MEKAGWISQAHVSQMGKPDKNVFSITPAGHDELVRWLRETGGSQEQNNAGDAPGNREQSGVE